VEILTLGGLGVLVLVGAALAAGLRDPVYAVLSLVLTMLGVAGVYFLLGAEYLGIIQVIVYAGAILVTFLFVVMLISLTKSDIPPLPRGGALWVPLGISLLWTGLLLYALQEVRAMPVRSQVLAQMTSHTSSTAPSSPSAKPSSRPMFYPLNSSPSPCWWESWVLSS
jgi:NADH:ubiquinone oxidoreductase subunit 6 (chain J)